MKNTAKLLLIPALLACAAAAQAQTAGSFLMVRGGVTTITPSVSSGDLTPPSLFGTKSAIGASTRLSGGLTYMLNDNIAIDLPLAVPFEHDITGDGAIAGAGKIGSVKALPATLLAQWRFMDYNSTIRPYIGAGVTYAKFLWRPLDVHADRNLGWHTRPTPLRWRSNPSGPRHSSWVPASRWVAAGSSMPTTPTPLEHPHHTVNRSDAGRQAGPQRGQPDDWIQILSLSSTIQKSSLPAAFFCGMLGAYVRAVFRSEPGPFFHRSGPALPLHERASPRSAGAPVVWG
jgi:outer membrane protein W